MFTCLYVQRTLYFYISVCLYIPAFTLWTLCLSSCLFKSPPEKAQSGLIGLREKYDSPAKLVLKWWVETLRWERCILIAGCMWHRMRSYIEMAFWITCFLINAAHKTITGLSYFIVWGSKALQIPKCICTSTEKGFQDMSSLTLMWRVAVMNIHLMLTLS